jgi:hypothetical protein
LGHAAGIPHDHPTPFGPSKHTAADAVDLRPPAHAFGLSEGTPVDMAEQLADRAPQRDAAEALASW